MPLFALRSLLLLLASFVTVHAESTQKNDTSQQNDIDDALKQQVQKYLNDCSIHLSNENETEKDNKKRNATSNDESDYKNDEISEKPSVRNHHRRNQNRNRNDNSNHNAPQNDRSNFGAYDHQHNERNVNDYNQNFGQNDYRQEQMDRRNGYEANPNYQTYRGYNQNPSGGYIRIARSAVDDDNECISQCVFGYLEVLDDNGSPSESAVIKWLQEHNSNDMKKMRALRQARRCFSKLATSDAADGCEFSKKISQCLNLKLE